MARIGELLDPVANYSSGMKDRIEQQRQLLQPNRPMDPIEMLLFGPEGVPLNPRNEWQIDPTLQGEPGIKSPFRWKRLTGLGDYLDPME